MRVVLVERGVVDYADGLRFWKRQLSYTIAANTGTVARTGTLTVAGKTVAVTQGVKPRPPANVRIVK